MGSPLRIDRIGSLLLFISEAVAAVYGTVGARLEGNLAGLSALCADSVEHLACAVVGSVFTLCAAFLAALGLVGEALLGIKFLLAGSESEFLSAFLADQGLVSVHEIPLSVITRSPFWLAGILYSEKGILSIEYVKIKFTFLIIFNNSGAGMMPRNIRITQYGRIYHKNPLSSILRAGG